MDVPVTAVYDANVLYPAPLRDLFIRLAQAGVVRARWTEEIHDEWVRNLLVDRPDLTPERLLRTRTLMNDAVRDCLVTGYDHWIPTLSLPDAGDRHVLAAALCAGAEVIVTFNLKDFPSEFLVPHGIAAVHPDEFVVNLLDTVPGGWCVKPSNVSGRDCATPREQSRNCWPPSRARDWLKRSLACGRSPRCCDHVWGNLTEASPGVRRRRPA